MSYRFIIAIDVEGETLPNAYDNLRKAMADSPLTNEWESTDEAYDPEGNAITEGALSAARMAVIDEDGKELERGTPCASS